MKALITNTTTKREILLLLSSFTQPETPAVIVQNDAEVDSLHGPRIRIRVEGKLEFPTAASDDQRETTTDDEWYLRIGETNNGPIGLAFPACKVISIESDLYGTPYITIR